MTRLNVGNIRHPDGTDDNITLDSAGRVGIGISNPGSYSSSANNLVVQDTAGEGGITIVSSTTAGSNIFFADTAGTAQGQIKYQHSGDYMRFYTDGSERARITSTGDFRFNSGYGSVATAYGVRAWVNFNGTGTVAIRDDGNVSSITDNGTGDYTVNFSNAMPDVNYSVCFGSNGGVILNGFGSFASDHLTTSHRFTCMGRQDSYTQGDPVAACLVYVR